MKHTCQLADEVQRHVTRQPEVPPALERDYKAQRAALLQKAPCLRLGAQQLGGWRGFVLQTRVVNIARKCPPAPASQPGHALLFDTQPAPAPV